LITEYLNAKRNDRAQALRAETFSPENTPAKANFGVVKRRKRGNTSVLDPNTIKHPKFEQKNEAVMKTEAVDLQRFIAME
jgi:hypothetical protein